MRPKEEKEREEERETKTARERERERKKYRMRPREKTIDRENTYFLKQYEERLGKTNAMKKPCIKQG